MKKFLYIILFLAMACSAAAGTFYISKSGNDTNDGLSWETAKLDLQGFVQTQTLYNIINIGAGEWNITNTHFSIPSNQRLIGTNKNEVILQPAVSNRVIFVNGTNVWLESLTVRRGTNRLTAAQAHGGGIWAAEDTIITNCNVYSNYTLNGNGGGIYMGKISNSEIYLNTLGGSRYGGGVHNATITDSIIYTNRGFYGGGVSDSIVLNSKIHSNIGVSGGGGFNCYMDGGEVYSNRTISGTIATAGLHYNSITTEVNNVFIYDNNSIYNGGGIGVRGDSEVTISNCVISNNYSLYYGAGIAALSTKLTSIIESKIINNKGGRDGVAIYAGIANPNYVSNCIISGNVSSLDGGNYVTATYINGLIIDSLISSNTVFGPVTAGNGVGLTLLLGSSIIGSTVEYNTYTVSGAFAQGAGILLSGNNLVSNCIVRYNELITSGNATRGGVGISGTVLAGYWMTNLVIDTIIHDNKYGGTGTGLGGGAAHVTLIRCTVSNNFSTYRGGAGYRIMAYNSVFVDNTAINLNDCIYDCWGSFNNTILNHTNLNLSPVSLLTGYYGVNNIVYGNKSDSIAGDVDKIYNNYYNDPMFITGAEGIYLIDENSPCVDAGSMDFYIDLPPYNLDYYLRDRLYGLSLDIGAVEWRPGDVPVTGGTIKKKALLMFWGL